MTSSIGRNVHRRFVISIMVVATLAAAAVWGAGYFGYDAVTATLGALMSLVAAGAAWLVVYAVYKIIKQRYLDAYAAIALGAVVLALASCIFALVAMSL